MNPLYLVACLMTLASLASAQTTTNSSSVVTTVSPAPSSQGQPSYRLSPERELSWLTTELGLSEAQQEKIKPILVAKAAQMKAIQEDSTLTNDQMHQQTKGLLKSSNQKIESLLLPGQVRAFAQLHQNKWAQKEDENQSGK
jgi:hypothetical protein